MIPLMLLFASFVPSLASHCELTPPDTDDDVLGPYFIKDVPYKGFQTAPPSRLANEERITVSGYILGSDCSHIPCAEIEIWGTDPNGGYTFNAPYWGRGRIKADENGFFQFQTWYPAYYPDGIFPFPIPRHIHFLITPPGGKSFITQMYFCGDERSIDKPANTRVNAVRANNTVDWEVSWNVVLNVVGGKSPAASCPADTGLSSTTSATMTEQAKVDAYALQGSGLFLDEKVVVAEFPAVPAGQTVSAPQTCAGESASASGASVSGASVQDKSTSCYYWSYACYTKTDWMLENCQKTCGYAKEKEQKTRLTDTTNYCYLYKNDCFYRSKWLLANCQKTCDYKDQPAPKKFDLSQDCYWWYYSCSTKSKWMVQNCPATCGY